MRPIIAKFTTFLFIAATFACATSCAWFQKNEKKFECIGLETIVDLPELVTIVTTCSTIAVSVNNIIPCILSAAGSKWAEETIACVAAAQAAQATKTDATAASLSTENRTRLRGAVSAQWGKQLGLQ